VCALRFDVDLDVTAKCTGGDATRKREAPGQTEKGQEENAAVRQGRHSARGAFIATMEVDV
jgi:translation elongation factor EF-4